MTVGGVLRGWWIVVLTTVLAAAAATYYSSTAPDRFEARGTYVIGPSDALTEPDSIVRSFDSLQSQGIVPTLVELLASTSIAEEVGEPLGLDRTALENYEIRAGVLSNSNTLELSAVGPDPELTAALTAGIGRSASTVFEDLYSVYQIRPLDVPVAPDDRASPNPRRNLLLAVLLGLTAGSALAGLRAQVAANAGRPSPAADRPMAPAPPPTGAGQGARPPVVAPPAASAAPTLVAAPAVTPSPSAMAPPGHTGWPGPRQQPGQPSSTSRDVAVGVNATGREGSPDEPAAGPTKSTNG